MKLSSERILTTHTGSLPRPEPIMELLLAVEHGEAVDQAAFDAAMPGAVAEAVREQVAAGIDVVSDGEMSKVGYATYVKDRFSGFEGESAPVRFRDLDDFPDYRRKMAEAAGTRRLTRPSCTGPVALKDRAPLEKDIANMRAALDGSGAAEGFLNAASPGVVAVFLGNQHYPSREAYLEALAEAMKEEYDAIVGAGLLLQLDCPDLAMGRHVAFRDASDAEFVKAAEAQVEALNHALRDVPREALRLHVCWGNYEGPHHFDIGLEQILGLILRAKPQAISFEAANPRHEHEWAVWRQAKLADDVVLIPGVIDSCTNYVEHPELVAERLCRYADIVGRERVIAGSDCGFGTFAGISKIDPKIAYAKLAAMAEGARIASKRLW